MAKKEDQAIHKLLKNVFGFDQFKGNQEEIIKSILARNNTRSFSSALADW